MEKEIQGLEDRYRGIDSHFSWIGKTQKWLDVIYNLAGKQKIYLTA